MVVQNKTLRPGDKLNTTGKPVVVRAAAPPTVGQALVAVDAETAEWQDQAGGGGGSALPTITLHQEKILAADVNVIGPVASLEITGLTIGQVYEVVGQVATNNSDGSGPRGNVQHNGVLLWSFQEDGTASAEGSTSGHFSEYFIATATNVVFTVIDANGGHGISGNAGKGSNGTWVQARHVVSAPATTVNVLAANITAPATIAALGFTGLTIGNEYEIIAQISTLIATTGSCTGRVECGGIPLFSFDYSGDGVEAHCSGYTSGVFVATATTIDFIVSAATANQLIEGDATKGDSGTFTELRPISTANKQSGGLVLLANAIAAGNNLELSFGNLVSGKTYEIVGVLSGFASDNVALRCQIEHNGTSQMGFDWDQQGGAEAITTGVTSGAFVAECPTAVFSVEAASASRYLKGDGTNGVNGSWLKLRELD